MRLDQMFALQGLNQAILDGTVRVRVHPDDPNPKILNYTEKAQYEGIWNEVTTQCRGLIYRSDTGEIVARPWAKFFNYGQHPEGSLDLDEPAVVLDKADGSLGIIYEAPDGGLAVATRGSFTSDQALHATELLRQRYPLYRPAPGWTTLVEIVYPGNRIVLDYGKLDDLILLGDVEIETGAERFPADNDTWPGPRTEHAEWVTTLRAALAKPPRPNAEGLVVTMLDSGIKVKVKQEDYVRLHRIITGLSEKSVWEHLMAHDGDYTELLAVVPDEFHGWVTDVAERLRTKHRQITEEAVRQFEGLTANLRGALGPEVSRKDFAMEVRNLPHRALLFALYDGKDIQQMVGKGLKPVGQTTMKQISEDVA